MRAQGDYGVRSIYTLNCTPRTSRYKGHGEPMPREKGCPSRLYRSWPYFERGPIVINTG